MPKRNLTILVICQLISVTGSVVIVTLGGIIGAELTRNPAYATLPVSMMIVAVAATTIPAAMLMRTIGRSRGFSLASGTAIVGLLLVVLAMRFSSFVLFIIAAMLFGINMAFTQQYRYAAAESVQPRFVPRAISFVLLGSIGGAMLGPELLNRGLAWVPSIPYAGIMLVLAVMFAVQAALFLQLRMPLEVAAHEAATGSRSLGAVAGQPVFLVAVLGGSTGYGLMTLLMTATPLSMHINDSYSLEDTASVIRMHVLGMYVPSLVSGFLIERFGVVRLMLVGAGLFVLSSLTAMQGHGLLYYSGALILLGVGWNFLYVGGTTMLTYTYQNNERFRAQAVNDFLVFGLSAIASLAAGAVMHYFGWNWLLWVPLPLIAAIVAALLLVRRDPLLQGRVVVGKPQAR